MTGTTSTTGAPALLILHVFLVHWCYCSFGSSDVAGGTGTPGVAGAGTPGALGAAGISTAGAPDTQCAAGTPSILVSADTLGIAGTTGAAHTFLYY